VLPQDPRELDPPAGPNWIGYKRPGLQTHVPGVYRPAHGLKTLLPGVAYPLAWSAEPRAWGVQNRSGV